MPRNYTREQLQKLAGMKDDQGNPAYTFRNEDLERLPGTRRVQDRGTLDLLSGLGGTGPLNAQEQRLLKYLLSKREARERKRLEAQMASKNVMQDEQGNWTRMPEWDTFTDESGIERIYNKYGREKPTFGPPAKPEPEPEKDEGFWARMWGGMFGGNDDPEQQVVSQYGLQPRPDENAELVRNPRTGEYAWRDSETGKFYGTGNTASQEQRVAGNAPPDTRVEQTPDETDQTTDETDMVEVVLQDGSTTKMPESETQLASDEDGRIYRVPKKNPNRERLAGAGRSAMDVLQRLMGGTDYRAEGRRF